MADFSQELEFLAAIKNETERLEAYRALKQKIIEAQKDLNKEYEKSVKLYGENSAEAIKNKNALDDLSKTLGRLQENLNMLKVPIATEAMKNLGEAVSKSTEQYGVFGKGLNQFAGGVLDKLGKGIAGNAMLMGLYNDKVARAVDPLSNLEFASNAVIKTKFGMISATKALNDALKSNLNAQNTARTGFTLLGESIEKANIKAMEYPTTLINMSAMFGMTTAQLNDFNKVVADLPGALDNISNSMRGTINIGDGMIQSSAVLMTALQAFGETGASAANIVRNSMLDMGLSVDQVGEYLGEMNIAMKDIDISHRVAADQMLRTGRTLGIFGDNASRATSIWATFASELRKSGVAATEVGKIFNQVSSGIANMSTQNRAFISMMSGMFRGASALGGALRMELAMRTPRGMERNLEALTSSLARFGGGQIITLEQAANNPQLEMQFTLQRQMLGKLAGIQDTQQQNRVLEVLQNVQRGGISQIDGAKELKNVVEKGRNLQERQVTALERIDQQAKQIFDAMNKQLSSLNEAILGGAKGAGAKTAFRRLGEVGVLQQGGFDNRSRAAVKDGARMFARQLTNLGNDIETFRRKLSKPLNFETIAAAARGFTKGIRGAPRVDMLPEADRPQATETRALISANAETNRTEEMRELLNIIKTPKVPGTDQTTPRIIGETESTITVKVDTSHEEFRDLIKSMLKQGFAEEAPKFSTGERE